MNERITPADDHDNAQALLPWYATGRLDAEEQAQVARHVAGCRACQADLALEAALAACAPEPLPMSPDAGWARLRSRLEPERTPLVVLLDQPRRPRPARRWFGDWRGWAIAAQFTVIALLAILLARAQPDSDYRVLGRAEPGPAGDLLVMFGPETPERTMRELLNRAGARVVDGPTVTGAYVLQTPTGGEQLALSRLRASRAVTMAEPLGPEPPP